jgi:hypothetical protein
MKIALFLLVTMIFGVSLASDTSNKKNTASIAKSQTTYKSNNDSRIDFILGTWTGTGYVTDANGLEQYIDIEETNSRLSDAQYQIVGTGKNPGNDFVYSYNKVLFFNNLMNDWYTRGLVNDTFMPDSRTNLGENHTFSYSYYDSKSVLVRHTTTRDSEDCFTETQEKWGKNGWYATAWFRMTRQVVDKNNTIAESLSNLN